MELDKESIATLRELRDRKDILDCVHRYSRGIDRRDAEMAKSAYHPDARDDHGHFIGGAHDFIDWLLPSHDRSQWASLQHYVTNHSVEINGDMAHGETYYIFVGRQANNEVQVHGGRYIDRFERRAAKWAIADRVCVYEWGLTPETAAWGLANKVLGHRNKEDLSYARPLPFTRAHRKP